MQFDAADITDILLATGEDITVSLDGAAVRTVRAKFRKDFETVSPFEASVGVLNPSFMCASSDMTGLTDSHTYTVRGVEYRLNGKPQELPSGFTRVILAKK